MCVIEKIKYSYIKWKDDLFTNYFLLKNSLLDHTLRPTCKFLILAIFYLTKSHKIYIYQTIIKMYKTFDSKTMRDGFLYARIRIRLFFTEGSGSSILESRIRVSFPGPATQLQSTLSISRTRL